MGNLKEHPASHIVRLLNIGESGTGKTGALASLAKAGYRLWILDYDNGLDMLKNALVEHYKSDPDGLKAANLRVNYATLRDQITTTNGIPRVKSPVTAYKGAGKQLAEWNASAFGPKDIIVLDTLTTFSEAAFREALALGSRLNQRPQLQDYGWVADSVKLFVEMLTDDDMKCNLIVNTHVRYFSGDDDSQTQARGLPNAIGQQIPATVSRYFNTVVLTRSMGSGAGTRRIISTQPQGVIEVKTSNPKGVKDTYNLDTGLADLFKDILGHSPSLSEGA